MHNEFEPACRRMEWLDPFYKAVWEKAFEKAIPISGTFELTPRCNFNCRMCYVHLKNDEIPHYGRELTAKEWLRIAEEAKQAGTTWLCITGGEPILHPEFPEIWEKLSQMGFFLTLQSNASLISGKIADLLEKYPPRRVKVTLYGADDDIYESVCGVKNGFSRVNDGIHTLMSLGIPVSLVSTIIRQNQEAVQKMAYYAYRHRLQWVPTTRVRASLRGGDTDVTGLRVNEMQEKHRCKEIQRRIREKDFFDPKRKPCTYCKDYRVGYWVLWDGNMRFCSFLDKPDISVRELSFQEAWKQLQVYEEALEWPDQCKECSAKNVCFKCIATLATESGSIDRVPEKHCNAIRNLYEKNKGKVNEDEL